VEFFELVSGEVPFGKIPASLVGEAGRVDVEFLGYHGAKSGGVVAANTVEVNTEN
jgi:hypothetical protein